VVTQTEAGIRIAGTITGLPANVTAGIHIHSGFSCAAAAEVGGHYYEGMTNDPWITTYTSDTDGVASILMDMEGFSLSEDMPVAGRTLVVHSPTSKIGCGLLEVSTGVVTHMGEYPGYSGAHAVKGTIVTKSTLDGIILTGTLAGLPASTEAGFHIHSGFSCASAAGVGGHYYEGMDSDPWTTTYTSDSSGAAQISLPMTGFSLTSSMPVLGRTLVVHSASSKIGCGVQGAAKMLETLIGHYPGFSGAAPKGSVVVTQTEAGIRIAGTITGLPANVTAGIHIHSGFSCAAAAEVGGHYYEGMTNDPWITTYTSDTDGVASILMDMEGFSLSEDMPVAGRTLVVHSPTSKIGCGLLEVSTGVVTHMGEYPGYSGAHAVKGTIVTKSTLDGIILTGTLAGLPASTEAGFHIHSGFSCASAAGVGGHYYEGMDSDPWTTTYTSDSSGAAQISLPMTGFSLTSSMPVLGRTLVVHSASSKIGCGLQDGFRTKPGDVEGSFKVRVPGCSSFSKITGLHASLAAALAITTQLDTWQVVVDLSCDASDDVLVVDFKCAIPPGDGFAIEKATQEILLAEEKELEHQIRVALQLKGISSKSVYMLQASLAGMSSAGPAMASTSTVTTITVTSTSKTSTTGTVTTTSSLPAMELTKAQAEPGLVGSICGEDVEKCEPSLLVVLSIASCLFGAICAALLRRCRGSPASTARPVKDLPVILNRASSSLNLSKQMPADGEKSVEGPGLEVDLEDGKHESRELSFGFLPTLEDPQADSSKNDGEVSPSVSAAVTNAVQQWLERDTGGFMNRTEAVTNALQDWIEHDEEIVISRV